MRIDSSGNVGIGVTPATTQTLTTQITNGLSLFGNNTTPYGFISNNHVWATGTGDKYLVSGYGASYYKQYSGVHTWATAPSGTANNPITFTPAMTLDASGNVGIGNTIFTSARVTAPHLVVGSGSASPGLTLYGAVNAQGSINFADSTSGTDSYDGGIVYAFGSGSPFMTFHVNGGAEAMRIDTGGSLLIGKTTPADLHASWNHIIIGEKGAIISTKGGVGLNGITLADNAYVDSDTGNYAYQTAGAASQITQTGGAITFSNAASGSAGAALTPVQTMAINADGKVDVGGVANQTVAVLNARFNGAAIEFGHGNNGAGYYGTAGSYGNNGQPYIGFSCYSQENLNLFTTNGTKGNIITGDLSGNLTFAQVTTATAVDQAPVSRMTLDASGNLLVGGTAAGNGGTVAVTGAVSISNSTANNQASMSKESMQQTSGVTTATTIFTSIIQGMSSAAAAQLIIYGNNNAASGFMDVVVTKGSGTPVVVSSTTVEGSPAARTYTMSGSALQLAMASGTYSVNVKCTTMGFPF
jgi:hypothetical protein